MRKKRWLGLVLPACLVLFMTVPRAGFAQPPALTVTYVANEGFLLASGGASFIVDALLNEGYGQYAVPGDALVARMTKGGPPFGHVDAVLVTHDHGDHFHAPFVAEFLAGHKEAALVASQSVCASVGLVAIESRQLRPLQLKVGEQAVVTAGKISVKAVRVKHAGDPDGSRGESLAYLVNLNGRKILHVGDGAIGGNLAIYRGLGLDKEAVDLLFLPMWDTSETTVQFVKDVVKPKHVVGMHLSAKDTQAELTKFRAAYPNAVVFEKVLDAQRF